MWTSSVRFGVRCGTVALMVEACVEPTTAQIPPSWTQVGMNGPARYAHRMAYDSAQAKTLMFGGFDSAGTDLGDTWEWNGSVWAQVATTGPSARGNHAMAYDSARGRTVMFGGYIPGPTNHGDTWEWDGAVWAQVATTGPVGREQHAMAYDSLRGRTVLFGGGLSGTWEWDGTNWAQMASSGPSPRWGSAMAFDANRGKTVLYGGNTNSGVVGDTWEWDGSAWQLQIGATGPGATHSHAMAYDSVRGRTVMYGGVAASTFTWEWDGASWSQMSWIGPIKVQHAMVFDSQRERTITFGGNYLLGDTWEWHGGLVSTATTFGTGCGSPALGLSPVGGARPTIGSTAQATLTNIPASLAFVSAGWSDTAAGVLTLPLSLAGYGMPGCSLLQSAEYLALPVVPAGPGAATFSMALPNWNGLIGLPVFLQGWAPSPGANTAGVIVSNGLEWVIGNT